MQGTAGLAGNGVAAHRAGPCAEAVLLSVLELKMCTLKKTAHTCCEAMLDIDPYFALPEAFAHTAAKIAKKVTACWRVSHTCTYT